MVTLAQQHAGSFSSSVSGSRRRSLHRGAAASRRSVSASVLAFQRGNSDSGSGPAQPSGVPGVARQPKLSSPPSTISTSSSASAVSWAGAGLYFFWQLGALKFLAEQFDLTRVPMVGASAGSMAAVLAACGVSADTTLQTAYEMSLKHNIWERPLGLLGIWGSLIEKWLDELLPDNAHEICRGRVTVVVTTLPDMAQVGISDFTDKRDLINAIMASSHIPWLLDWSPTRACRGKRCVDGSFPDFFTGENCELLRGAAVGDKGAATAAGRNVVFDYFDDSALQRKGRMEMLQLQSYDEILRRYRLGYEYAAKLHADGRFDHFRLAELVVQGEGEGMSEVLVPEGQQPQAQPADVVVSAPAAAAAAPTQGKPGGNNIVAVPVTAHMHNPNSMHHPAPTPSAAPPPQQQAGLVLELHQPHEELHN